MLGPASENRRSRFLYRVGFAGGSPELRTPRSVPGPSCCHPEVEGNVVAVTYNAGPRHHSFNHLQTLQTAFTFQNVPIQARQGLVSNTSEPPLEVGVRC